MESINLEQLCQRMVGVVSDAGSFIRREFENFDISKIESKGRSNDLVSYVDKETEKMLVAGLRLLLPQAGFIGEEGASEEGQDGLQWVIDPLDGTTNFLHGIPSFAISVALIRGKEVLVGTVYEINLDECFYAWKGGGAYLNGNQINVSGVRDIKDSLIATGFPYSLRGKADEYFEIIKYMVNHSHGLRRIGAAAVDLAYVACGRVEAYFEFNIHIWDIAAGVLLVQEAGGKVTDYSGGDDYLSGRELLAAGPIHSEALGIIQKFW
jgi:myo-inositol-1(or 4)-monophosphatase